ncbi:MAG TPA: hypothetical protein VG244_04385 [Acidimicrobiales bacterium]|jgi:hypothetical protein|nr:hypothetical protein [Acidimicrobiales bacterium]
MDAKLTAMAQRPPFGGLTRRELVGWARRLDAAHIAVGQSVRISTARSRWMYLVLDGSGLVTRDGRAHTILRPGDCELPGGEAVAASSLVALTPMTVLSIPRAAARELDIPWVVTAGAATDEGRRSAGARVLLSETEPDLLPEYDDAAGELSYRG